MSVMLYPCMLWVSLLMCLFVLCVACLTIPNVFGCSCYFVVECYGSLLKILSSLLSYSW